jgi:hypothetical protein
MMNVMGASSSARLVRVGLLAAALTGCSGTEPTHTPEPPKAFAGTIFAARISYPTHSPLLLNGAGGESLMPVDLTMFWDGTWEEDFWRMVIGRDYDVSRDGRYLYADVTNYVVRFDLPGGGVPEVLAITGPTRSVRVSPNGEWLVFQQVMEGNRLILMRSDGTGDARVILAPTGIVGVSYHTPVWVTDDHLMVPVTRSALEPPYGWVLELKAPHWIPQEYEPIRVEARGTVSVPSLVANPAGDRLYLHTATNPISILEYPLGQFTGEVKVRLPLDAGGHMVISPDGRYVATFEWDGDVEGMGIYEIATGKRVAYVPGAPNRAPLPVAWVAREYP